MDQVKNNSWAVKHCTDKWTSQLIGRGKRRQVVIKFYAEFSLGDRGGQLSLIKLRGDTCPSCFSLKKKHIIKHFPFFLSEIQHRKRGVSYQPQQPEFLKGFATLRLVRCSNYKFLELRKVTETKRFLRFDHQYGNNRELPYSRHLMRCGKAIGCFSGLYPWYQRVIFVTCSFLIVRGKPQQKPASRLICLSSALSHRAHGLLICKILRIL